MSAVSCPLCGSEDTEWVDIMGDAVRPSGSVYQCLGCGNEFDETDIPLPDDVPECPGCGNGTHSEGSYCRGCVEGRHGRGSV